jgi:3,4-dihydroxy 2-butanone 4-phosphate synthase/GTP cyclohydrolase II
MSDQQARLDSIERAIADVAAGRPVVVVDDADRENEGDLIFAAGKATPELVGFMVRYSSGVICVALEGPTLDRLDLPPMTMFNQERRGTAYTISVDAREGISTGISAADRSHTIRMLADSATEPHELSRPGHIFPLRYREGGVLARPGHTEASVDLARLAGLTPAGVLCEIVNDDGTMARLPELEVFAREHGLALISIADLIAYRRRRETQVTAIAEARLPTRHGEFRAVGYRNLLDGTDHIALVRGDIGDGTDILVRVHSECLTGDVFGSMRCDCGMQLDAALELIAGVGRGVVLYVRGHEGRGIGLLHKLQAYQLQDRGRDTVDANLDLGLPADARDYGTGAQILVDLGIRTMRLVTNNPTKRAALEGFGLEIIDRVPMPVSATPENLHYLQTKRDRMGHELPDLPSLDTTESDDLTRRAAVLPPLGGASGTPAPTPAPRPATPLRSGLAGIVHDDDTEPDDAGDGRVQESAR